jgi:hydrogen cyanide synthase HcnC
VSGYLNACGHFRTGVLNAPLTGQIIADLAAGEAPSYPIDPFLLSRFAVAGHAMPAPREAAGVAS